MTFEDKIKSELEAAARNCAKASNYESKGWTSVTFAGKRVTALMTFEGSDKTANAVRFENELPGYEFSIPNCLVAEARVVDVLQVEGSISTTVQLLTMEDY